MFKKSSDQLIQERESLLLELAALSQLVHGSIFSRYTVCSRPGCKCHHGEKHGPTMCFMLNDNGRQHQQYVPKKLQAQAKAAVDEYNHALTVIDRISAINLQLFKMRSPGRCGKNPAK